MKLLAYTLLCGLAAVPSPNALAQTASPGTTAQQQQAAERDKGLVVAPQAAPAANPQVSATEPPGTGAGPANICRELVAFLEKKAAAQQPAAGVQPGPNPATSAAGASVQASGQPAPVPQAPAGSAPNADALAKASVMAEANDLQGCQQTARTMRRAGLDLPPALLALAALKPELLGSSKP
jgi:hypothetical protein